MSSQHPLPGSGGGAAPAGRAAGRTQPGSWNSIGRLACLAAMVCTAWSPDATFAQTYDPQMPPPYSVYGGPADGAYTYGRTRYTQLPDDKGFGYGDTNFERLLKETFRHAYFRLEYLNWSYSDPGDNLLGAPILRDDPTGDFIINPATFSNDYLINTSIPFRVPGLTINGVDSNDIENLDFEDLGFSPENGLGINPTLSGVKNIHNNGLRGTWGINLERFTWESSVFALQSSRATVTPRYVPVTSENGQPTSFSAPDVFDDTSFTQYNRVLVDAIPQTESNDSFLPPYINGTFVVQGLLRNGQLDNNSYLIYDRSFEASIRTSLWGADTKVLCEGVTNGGLFSMRPLLGAKFVNFNERLEQHGTASAGVAVANPSFDSLNEAKAPDDAGEPQPDVYRQINSDTQNYLYGPQLGARFELGNRFFTIGCEPKMMFGVNSYKSTLEYSLPVITAVDAVDDDGQPVTDFEPLENTGRSRIAKTTFGPVADVNVYARGRMSDHVNVFVSYNVMWAGMITRPANNIVYNVTDNGVFDFSQDVRFTDLLIQGVSVGGEVHW